MPMQGFLKTVVVIPFTRWDRVNLPELQEKFTEIAGVAILGGCCGTTPQHILELTKRVEGKKPLAPVGSMPRSITLC